MIILIAKFIAQPGKEALLAEECTKIARIVREKEKGCLQYLPLVSVDNPAEIISFEKYADQEAFDAHLQSPYVKQLMETFKELLAEELQVQFVRELI